ncbi:MAG: hypothetical protein IKR69_01200 [Bacteroidales bacterium]|nr:hypothetical protein [Bacteroidales bacterium]
MKRGKLISEWIAVALLAAALLLGVASLLLPPYGSQPDKEAAKVSRVLERRLERLDVLTRKALEQEEPLWASFPRVPDDMVLYRYEADTLESWIHTFPIGSDDLTDRILIQRIGDNRSPLISPLSKVGTHYTYTNLGSKWYVLRRSNLDGRSVIAGEEIDKRFSRVYAPVPLSSGTGPVVSALGQPLFKLDPGSFQLRSRATSPLLWIAFLMAAIALVLLQAVRPSLRRFSWALPAFSALMAAVYFSGRSLGSLIPLFSPIVYAGGGVLYSLGAVLILNAFITELVFAVWLVRKDIFRRSRGSVFGIILPVLAQVGIIAYTHLSFRSIVLNSGITLELFRISSLSYYTAMVYASYLLLGLSLPMLTEIISPYVRRRMHFRYDTFSRTSRLAFACSLSLYFVLVSSITGFQKEKNRVDVWANSLALDRDISLEIQLQGVEDAIASDPVIASLSVLGNTSGIIRSRIIDNYMGRLSQAYDISVVLLGDAPSPAQDAMLGERIRDGVQISETSRFFYSLTQGGRARYSGFYTYYSEQGGASAMLLGVEPKSNREDLGYLSLMGISEPGRVMIPKNYSYAKYHGGKLSTFKGAYPYPTMLPEALSARDRGEDYTVGFEGFVHFVHCSSPSSAVVVSRERVSVTQYLVEWMIFTLASLILVSLFLISRPKKYFVSRSYYRARINMVLYTSLTLTLVLLTGFSVWFVYKRALSDSRANMMSKLGAITNSVQSRLRMVETQEELREQRIITSLDNIGTNLKSDINLYSPDGRLLLTTAPELLDRMIIGRRMAGEAVYNIRDRHSRYFFNREKLGNHPYYALYAPVFNHSGDMTAIICTPYAEDSGDFRSDAIFHIATIIVFFLVVLMVARMIVSTVILHMFSPLEEMGRKMNVRDVRELEPIEYDSEDEISALVRTYNMMVHDLAESTELLARSERDKAWSEMARQVAHEIKNPLTPIKLQLQMLIRMKQSGKGAWTEKFDEVASTVLSHIDILADTAGEFSTFAKLYTEDPVRIDLGMLLEEEVSMFSSRSDIKFDYIGLDGAVVMGPKPQLTRVIVNLLTNAVQAVSADGREGAIMVSLRNSTVDGFYDIVIEDNGPGVPPENTDKLFTPNFTTKSGGSGLGLAISRSIVDRCGGTLFYSRSAFLSGASFTVRYPKNFAIFADNNARV